MAIDPKILEESKKRLQELQQIQQTPKNESFWSKTWKTAQEIQWFNILFVVILIVSIFILIKRNFATVKSFLLDKQYANKRLIILIIFVLLILASSLLLNSNLSLSCSVSAFLIKNDCQIFLKY